MDRWTRTHQALQQAALELVARDGYDATGTAQVAARAGVREMTLFRHFPTKADLILVDPFDPAMAAAVRSRPGDEPPLRALAEGIRDTWTDVSAAEVSALRERLRLVAASPALRAALPRSTEGSVRALAAALAERGTAPTLARAAAHAMVQGLGLVLLDWAEEDVPDGQVPDPTPSLHAALDLLGGG